VDIGVYLRCAPAGGSLARGLELADRLSDRVRLPVDVRILNDAPLTFLYHVLRGQLLVNREEDLLAGVMERTIRDYLDIAPVLRRATKEAFGG
jgi:hypothetical protein